MDPPEDIPMDIRNARPVEEEIRKAEEAELQPLEAIEAPPQPPFSCQNKPEPPSLIDDDARVRQERKEKHEARKTVVVYRHGPECPPHVADRTPRKCFTRKEYLDFLARPKCVNPCERKREVRRLRPISARMEDLARPPTRRLIQTLGQCGSFLAPEMVEHLIKLVEVNSALTPEQAEDYVRDCRVRKSPPPSSGHASRSMKRREVCCREERRRGSKSKCRNRKKKKKKKQQECGDGEPALDPEATRCQYAMAERFVRSILRWRGSTPSNRRPSSEYQEITEVILRRLSQLLDYEPLGNEDRKSVQMRLLADLFGCWIAGLLIEVAEKNKEKIEAECELQRRVIEEQQGLEILDELSGPSSSLVDYNNYYDNADDDDDDNDDANKDKEEEEEEEDGLSHSMSIKSKEVEEKASMAASNLAASEHEEFELKKESVDEEEQTAGSSTKIDAESQYMPEEVQAESSWVDEEYREEPSYGALQAQNDASSSMSSLVPSKTEASLQTEAVSRSNAATAAEYSRELIELEKMASRLGASMRADLPFLTFARILDALYAMIECEPENKLCEAGVNRLHRAIYEKLEPVVLAMDGCGGQQQLAERTRDVLDVVTGKVARWLYGTLDASQLRNLDKATGQVESREVRDWSRQVGQDVDMAEKWADWLVRAVVEGDGIKRAPCNVTRATWRNYTDKVKEGASCWRRAHLEAAHRQHHNTMMICEREVVKSKYSKGADGTSAGQRAPQDASEVAIANTDLARTKD